MKRPDPLETAAAVANEAGAALLRYLRQPREISEKARRADLVTDADRASEAIVIAHLRREYPHATILAEESGMHPGSNDERWIVDPLDGTTNFAHGYPLFCVSIAYERGGELIAGAIYAPAMGELFVAQRGAGAQLNQRAIAVSPIARLGDAMTCTGFHPGGLRTQRHLLSKRFAPRASGAPRRLGRARSRLPRVRTIRRFLGVRFECVGCRGRNVDSARSRWNGYSRRWLARSARCAFDSRNQRPHPCRTRERPCQPKRRRRSVSS